MSDVLRQIREFRAQHEAEEVPDALLDQRQQEVEALRPRPACCGRAEAHIRFRVHNGGMLVSDLWMGSWCMAGVSGLAACPFCRDSLPVMRRKRESSADLCRVTDGGDYCATCHERLHSCLCDPLESDFELLPADASPHTLCEDSYTAADVEVYYDPMGRHSGRSGCWRARLRHRRGVHDAGPTEDHAFRNFERTADSFGLRLVGRPVEE